MPDGRPCLEDAWSFLVWHIAYYCQWQTELCTSVTIAECMIELLECCLSKGADPNSTCLISVAELQGRGYFIREVSVLSIIQCARNGPLKAKLLQKMASYNAKPYRSFEYYLDSELAFYQLKETQSDLRTKAQGDSDMVASQCNFLPQFCYRQSNERGITECEKIECQIRDTLGEATKLGSLNSGVIIGDKNTYETSFRTEEDR